MTNSHPNPYIGPRSFLPHERLYGREVETRKLVNLLGAERIVLLHSPSGAGKTSLVQAALIPKMQERKFHVRPLIRVNQELPTPGAGNRYVFSVLSSLEQAYPEAEQLPDTELMTLTLTEYLVHRPKPAETNYELWVFDQFEEVLTFAPTDQTTKHAFFEQLGELLTNRTVWALFAMREDYLGALDPYGLPIPNRLRVTFRLDLLKQEAALQALQKPAASASVTFEDGAAQALVDDLRRVQVQRPDGSLETLLGPHVEPVQLQVVAYRLWESLTPNATRIDNENLRALGDVGQALADYYAGRMTAIAYMTEVKERAIREWFDRRLITEQGLRGQVLMGPERSEGLDNRAVQALENAHLIRGDKRGGAIWYELSHDRLIEPVRANNAAWFKANLNLLQTQADLWARQNRADSFLSRGKALEQVERESRAMQLTPIEQDFLTECRKLRDQEAREKLRTRLIMGLAMAALIALAVAVVFGVRANAASQEAVEQKNVADQQRATAQVAGATAVAAGATAVAARATADVARLKAEAEARNLQADALAAKTEALLSANFPNALLLALEAFHLADKPQTRDALLDVASANPQLVQLIAGHQSPITSIAFNPDGQTFASSSEDGLILLWDVATRTRLEPPLVGPSGGVTSLAFSPDGKTLASGNADNTLRLWDVTTHRPLGGPLTGHTGRVTSVAFNPSDGSSLASGSEDTTIILWDIQTRQPKALPLSWYTSTSSVLSLAFSPDGKTLVSGQRDSTLILWDLATYQPIGKPLTAQKDGIRSVAFSSDGRSFAGGSDDATISVWNVATRRLIRDPLAEHVSSVVSVAFRPNSQDLVSGGNDATLILWRDARPTSPRRFEGHVQGVHSLAFSPDGQMLVSGGEDGTLILWNVVPRQNLVQPLTEHVGQVTSLAYSRDHKLIASSGNDLTIRLWDTATRKVTLLTENKYQANTVTFSPDGQTLASGNTDKTIRLWNVATREQMGPPLLGHTKSVLSVAFSPDGQSLASGSADTTVIVWDLTQPISYSLTGHAQPVNSVAFSPNGQTLASGSDDGTIRLWEVATHAALGQLLTREESAVNSIAFSPDGRTLASGSANGTLRLWDLATQNLILSFNGKTRSVNSLAFSPDGKILAAGSDDKTIRLWEAATGQPFVHPFAGHTNGVTSIVFSADGKTLISGSRDRKVMQWNVALEVWQEQICQRAGRNFTRAEWEKYGLVEPYRATCAQWPIEKP